jgi:hypothetical protein
MFFGDGTVGLKSVLAIQRGLSSVNNAAMLYIYLFLVFKKSLGSKLGHLCLGSVPDCFERSVCYV